MTVAPVAIGKASNRPHSLASIAPGNSVSAMPTSSMRRLLKHWLGAFGALALLISFAPAAWSQVLFADGFEAQFNIPQNDAEAARFLNQATFGATPSEIAAVRAQGISAFLDAQLNSATVTLSRPWLEAYITTLGVNAAVSRDDRIHRWFNVAVTAPDQVRQRVAWALSQLIVVSDQHDTLGQYPVLMAEWNDLLVRNALGNYRTLLREATMSPMMGRWLTTLRNRKFELQRVTVGGNLSHYTAGNNGVQPDENYAREIMQLFSIGLLRRNSDFSLFDGDPGTPGVQPVPTYDEDTISTLARVFTGLSHDCSGDATVAGVTINRACQHTSTPAVPCVGVSCRFTNAGALFGNNPPLEQRLSGSNTDRGLLHPDWYRPMVCYPRYNDNGRDTSGADLPDPDNPPPLNQPLPAGSPHPDKVLLIAGTTPLIIGPSVINGLNPLNCHRTSNGGTSPLTAAEMDACVAYCEGGINSAVDLLFNHPNTPVMVARTLIQRLVTSNPTPDYISRVSAVFVNNGSGVRGDMKAVIKALLTDREARQPFNFPGQPVNFGKSHEPMLKLVQVWRSMGAVSGDTGVFPAGNVLEGQPARRRWGPANPQDAYVQRPLGSATVFNFYEPDYQQPGAITGAGLFSPEFQIIHEVSSVATANDLYSRFCAGYGSNNCSGAFTLPTDRAYFPTATVDSWPTTDTTDATALTLYIEFLNTRVFDGTMSGTMLPANSCAQGVGTGTKGTLYALLRCTPGLSQITGGTAQDRDRRRKLYLLHLASISPEFNTQR